MSSRIPYQQLQLRACHTLRHDLWQGWSAAEQSRQYCEFWLVLDGGAYLRADGKEYRLQAGDICLLPDILPKENGCDVASHFDVIVTHFEAKLLSASMFEYIRCAEWVVHPDAAVFDRLYEGTNTPIHSRTYVKLADGTIIYGDVASYTYNEVAGVQ